ncbi:flagella basal body P-ring formation protein FlgA [Pelagerythrobacter marensis]|uniref:Flagellar protein n=1 Tax=Pelagerythrobacter marensis TaxID=543877 RepID=A0A0G3X3T5_9SPHN|nr:flagella basal body P-ring formation protein FlgA [Pelagerythrobacter marensis]AKM06180.1 flagellar protein [Pelagerythrobacter marensis]
MRPIRTILAAGAIAVTAPALAAGFHDLSSIDREVERFTGSPQGSRGGAQLPVDRRLKLTQCPTPIALEWYGSGNRTVLVRCPVSGGWRLFVPVAAAEATAAKAEPVISRGESVSIAIQGSGFTVSRQGEALEGGAVGEWIRVRPAGEKREAVRARVIQPGRVGIDLP